MSTENPTPDLDLDDPHIAAYATKVDDPAEVLLRADFARMCELREQVMQSATAAEIEKYSDRAHEIHRRRSDLAADGHETWEYLSDAHQDWLRAPATMRRLHEQIRIDQASGWHALTGVQWRSQQQARELTGHGAWTTEPTTGTERVPISGHAFEGLVNDRGQEMER